MQQPIHIAHQTGKIVGSARSLAAQRSLQAGHSKRGSDALTGDVTDREPQFASGQRQKIVVVAADSERRAAGPRISQARDGW